MQDLQEFESGETFSKLREKLNAIVRKLKQLSNIKGSGGVIVKHGPGGIQISAPHRVLLIDDKYRLDEEYNKNTMVKRRADDKYGDIGDQFRVRAVAEGTEEREKGERYTLPAYKLMWLLNPGGEHTPEGGWMTDSADEGMDKEENSPEHEIPTPIRRIAQLGDVVILTDDDEMALTEDGDIYTLSNIRHDAHFHKGEPRDGRLYLTNEPVGIKPEGIKVDGIFVGDPALANTDTQLGHESVNWIPQIPVPRDDPVWWIQKSPDLDMPVSQYIPGTLVMAAKFAGPPV